MAIGIIHTYILYKFMFFFCSRHRRAASSSRETQEVHEIRGRRTQRLIKEVNDNCVHILDGSESTFVRIYITGCKKSQKEWNKERIRRKRRLIYGKLLLFLLLNYPASRYYLSLFIIIITRV